MWSDTTRFHLTAALEAWESDALVYTREESDTVPGPRDHL